MSARLLDLPMMPHRRAYTPVVDDIAPTYAAPRLHWRRSTGPQAKAYADLSGLIRIRSRSCKTKRIPSPVPLLCDLRELRRAGARSDSADRRGGPGVVG
eukprot:scaffold2249_cov272-Pinguiococcus_pyrenoidosus.AAC.12